MARPFSTPPATIVFFGAGRGVGWGGGGGSSPVTSVLGSPLTIVPPGIARGSSFVDSFATGAVLRARRLRAVAFLRRAPVLAFCALAPAAPDAATPTATADERRSSASVTTQAKRSCFEVFIGFFLRLSLQVGREARGEGLLRLRADDALDLLAVLVDEERGDAAYVQRLRGLRVLVHVELGDAVEPCRLRGQSVERGRYHSARAAPCGPTVYEHGPRARLFDNVALERRVRH